MEASVNRPHPVTYSFDLSRLSPAINRTCADFLYNQRRSMENIVRDQFHLKSEIAEAERRNAELRGEIEALGKQLEQGAAGGALPNLVQPRPPQQQLYPPAAPGHAEPQPAQRYTPSSSERDLFRLERVIKAHTSPVHSVAMDPHSAQIATASWDATVKLTELATGEVVRTLGDLDESRMGGLYSVAFSRTQEDILGCTSADTNVYIWNYKSGKLQCKLQGHLNEVNGIDFHPLQQVCATASDDCKCMIWDLEQQQCLRVMEHGTKPVYGCKFMGIENQYLVSTCSFDCIVRVFDMRSREVVARLQPHADDVTGIDYCSSTQTIATGSDDGKIALVDARHHRLTAVIDTKEVTPDNEVKRVAFGPDGSWLAAACSSGMVLVYDVSQPNSVKRIASMGGHTDCVFDVAWGVHRSGARMLVSASHDHQCGYWLSVL